MDSRRQFRFGTRPAKAAGAALCLAVVFLVAGCGGSSEQQGGSGLRAENRELRQENEQLEGEVERLEEESEGLRSDVADARAEAEEVEAAAGEAQAEATTESGGDSGGQLAVAEPGEVEGEPLPEVFPEGFPLPTGGSIRDVYEDEYSFSMTIPLDSTFEETVAFYDGQLPAEDWEELVGDRIEGETEGFQGIETSWEKGTFIPLDSPQDDPNYEQTKENLSLSIYELDPSGVQVDIRWSDYELLDQQNEAEEDGTDEGQSS